MDLANYFESEQLDASGPETPGRRVLQQPVMPGKHSCILKVRILPLHPVHDVFTHPGLCFRSRPEWPDADMDP